MVCFITIKWSTVALPGIPPAWASVICTTFFTLSLMILSYTLPMLLARVISLSFEHLPLVPLPLYSLIMWPWSQLAGICSSWCILFIVVRRAFFVFSSASMKISFGMPSGPRLFFRFSFFYYILEFFVCDFFFSLLIFFITFLQLSFWLDALVEVPLAANSRKGELSEPMMALIEFLGTNFRGILSKIQQLLFKRIHLKIFMSLPKWWPLCVNCNVLTLKM